MYKRADGKTMRNKAEWEEIIKRYKNSSLTQDEFCESEGIAKSSLLKWRKKFGEESAKGFIEVLPSSVADNRGVIELELPHGIVLRIS